MSGCGRRWPIWAWLTLSLALLACVPAGALAAEPRCFDRIVAVVNDDIITLCELEEAAKPVLAQMPSQPGADHDKQVYEAKLQVLRLLIDQKLAEQEINRLGIKVAREDVDRVIEDVKREMSMNEEQLKAALQEDGIGWEQYRKQVTEQLCRARLINEEVRAKIVITDDRCRKYYDDNQKEFTLFEEAELEHILLGLPKGAPEEQTQRQRRRAEEALAMLKAGADFPTLAKQYSEAGTAKDGGSLGWVKVQEMAPFLKDVVKGLHPGQISDVLTTEQGFQVFHLKDYRQGGLKPYEQVKDEIYRKLFQREVDREYEAWLKALREKAYIKLTF